MKGLPRKTCVFRGILSKEHRTGQLKFDHVASLRASAAVHNFELDVLSLGQGSESVRLNGCVMNKHIQPFLIFYEAIPFSVVEPLDFAF